MRSERVYEAHPYREQIGTNMEASELMITLSTISHARRTNDILLRIVSRAGETNPRVHTTFDPATAFNHNSVLCGMDKGVVEKIFEATLLKTVSKWPRLLHGVQTLGFSACVETVETGVRESTCTVGLPCKAIYLGLGFRITSRIEPVHDLPDSVTFANGHGGREDIGDGRGLMMDAVSHVTVGLVLWIDEGIRVIICIWRPVGVSPCPGNICRSDSKPISNSEGESFDPRPI